MGAMLVPIVLIGVVFVVAAVAITKFSGGARRLEDPLSLYYELPVGEDPAVVVGALNEAGYAVTLDEGSAHARVLIATQEHDVLPDREVVRQVIRRAHQVDAEGDTPELAIPRFTDE